MYIHNSSECEHRVTAARFWGFIQFYISWGISTEHLAFLVKLRVLTAQLRDPADQSMQLWKRSFWTSWQSKSWVVENRTILSATKYTHDHILPSLLTRRRYRNPPGQMEKNLSWKSCNLNRGWSGLRYEQAQFFCEVFFIRIFHIPASIERSTSFLHLGKCKTFVLENYPYPEVSFQYA